MCGHWELNAGLVGILIAQNYCTYNENWKYGAHIFYFYWCTNCSTNWLVSSLPTFSPFLKNSFWWKDTSYCTRSLEYCALLKWHILCWGESLKKCCLPVFYLGWYIILWGQTRAKSQIAYADMGIWIASSFCAAYDGTGLFYLWGLVKRNRTTCRLYTYEHTAPVLYSSAVDFRHLIVFLWLCYLVTHRPT